VWPTPAQPIVCQGYVRAVHAHTERLPRLDQALQEQVTSWRWHPVVEARQAWRGVPCTAAVTMVAEIGDLTRVESPRALMKFLGLLPSAYTSAERRRQGAMTKAVHTHARSQPRVHPRGRASPAPSPDAIAPLHDGPRLLAIVPAFSTLLRVYDARC
jgi:transposase